MVSPSVLLTAIVNALPAAKRKALDAQIHELNEWIYAQQRRLVPVSKTKIFYARVEGDPETHVYESLDDAAAAVGISPSSLRLMLAQGQGLWSRRRGGVVAVATSEARLEGFFNSLSR